MSGVYVLVISVVAGVVGTGLGGVLGALLKGKGQKFIGNTLAFAGGVMLGVVTFEMIPEGVEQFLTLGKVWGVTFCIAAVFLGVAVIAVLNALFDRLEKRRAANGVNVNALGIAEMNFFASALAYDSPHGKHTSHGKSDGMLRAGIIMLIAIALHNIPEGMAIGASSAADKNMGLLVAIVIALHNVPEGMAVATPLVSGGVKPVKAVFLSLLAGFATVIGALIGALVGEISEIATGICLSLASGAMLYVTLNEILPEAIDANENKLPSVSLLVGIIVAAVFVFLL